MKDETTAPRWGAWLQLPAVKLWQAVALSIGREPTEPLREAIFKGRVTDRHAPPFVIELLKRWQYCEQALDPKGPIKPQGHGLANPPVCPVLLSEVAAFFAHAGFGLPEELCALVLPADSVPPTEAPAPMPHSPEATGNDPESEPRYIAGRRLWTLPEAIETIAAMPGFGVTAEALKARVEQDCERGKLTVLNPEHGAEEKSFALSVWLRQRLYAEDFNAWLEAAGYPEPYRLRGATAPAAAVPVPVPDNEWQALAQKAARAIVNQAAASDRYPSQPTIADEIAADFRKRGIVGAGGKPLRGATIKRHALRGISSATKKARSTTFKRGK